jgi:guanine deaminase
MHSWHASLLRFDGDDHAVFDRDGLLVTGADDQGCQRVLAAGNCAALAAHYADVPCTRLPGHILAPGFVDMHVHYPQTDVIGSPADGLLPWLERYVYPHEARFADPTHAAAVAAFFCDELARNGITTALVFGTSHPASIEALFAEGKRRQLRLMTGKTLQDRHSPDGVRDDTEQSLVDTEALIRRWHGVDRLGCAIAPRFAPSCSDAQLRGAGELAARWPDVWIHSHLAENRDEVAWALALFSVRSYLSIYADRGLLRPRTVLAHGIHIDDAERLLLRDTQAAVAVCPTSNLFLGSGFFDFAGAANADFPHGLCSDVGAGTSFSPFATMRAAWYVNRAAATPHAGLTPERLWWLHTAGAARALGLQGVAGNLQPGCEADFVILDPAATPLLARRTAQAASLSELLFALIVLGDDRVVKRTVISQAQSDQRNQLSISE